MNLAYITLFILIHRVILENTWQVFHFIDEETDVLKGGVICSKLQLVETRYYCSLSGFFKIYTSDLQTSLYPLIEINIF